MKEITKWIFAGLGIIGFIILDVGLIKVGQWFPTTQYDVILWSNGVLTGMLIMLWMKWRNDMKLAKG